MSIVFDIKKLKEWEKRLMEEVELHIGILGAKTDRATQKKYNYDNAGVGKKHEFGLFAPEIGKRMPVRSFLRMPMKTHYFKRVEKTRMPKEDFEAFIHPNDKIKFYRRFGEIAKRLIDDAFKTRGFGQWRESVMSFKKVHQTLVETSQLRRSITFKVINK